MKEIWKFVLRVNAPGEHQEVPMPVGAEVLCVQLHDDNPTLWALVDPAGGLTVRRFVIYPTGTSFDPIVGCWYLGTYQQRTGYVGHVFGLDPVL